jgi:hypothetical protein
LGLAYTKVRLLRKTELFQIFLRHAHYFPIQRSGSKHKDEPVRRTGL